MTKILASRTFKYGSNAIILALIVLGIVAVINYLSIEYHKRFDVTPGKLYSLSDQTKNVLKNLDKDIKITAFYREMESPKFKDLLQEYSYYSDRFSYELIDPDKNPAIAKQYGIRAYRTTVIESDGASERIESDAEKDVTSAIMKVTRGENKVIYFTMGHGEADIDNDKTKEGYSIFRDRLKESNYNVEKVILAQEGGIPQDCDLLVVAGPQNRLFNPEIGLISTYLDKGGDALFLLDPLVDSGLEAMLRSWSVEVGDDFVVDFGIIGKLFGLRDNTMPVTTQYGNHEITQKHQRIMTFYPLVRSVSAMDQKESGTQVTELVLTSSESWAETSVDLLQGPAGKVEINQDPDEKGGPVSLAVAVVSDARMASQDEESEEDGDKKSRIVVFGDHDFGNNQFFGQQGNGDLLMNSVNWVLEEEELISIRPKTPGFNPVTLSAKQGDVVFYISVVVLPALILLSGVAVWWRRK